MVIRGENLQVITTHLSRTVAVDRNGAVMVDFAAWLLELQRDLVLPPEQQQQEAPGMQTAPAYDMWTGKTTTTSRQRGQSTRDGRRDRIEQAANPPAATERRLGRSAAYIQGQSLSFSSVLSGRPPQVTGASSLTVLAIGLGVENVAEQLSDININNSTSRDGGRVRTAAPTTPIRSNQATTTRATFRRRGDLYPQVVPRVIWEHRPTYTKPTHTRETFEIGDVVSRPFHVPNMRHRAGHIGEGVAETYLYNYLKIEGNPTFCHVYTKRRMFVIMFKHARTMFYLPLYTHQDRGFAGIPRDRWYDHVGLRDTLTRDTFVPHGYRRPIGFVHLAGELEYALSVNSTIDIVSGMTMSWEEDEIEPVGRFTKAGYDRLLSYYNELVATMQREAGGVNGTRRITGCRRLCSGRNMDVAI